MANAIGGVRRAADGRARVGRIVEPGGVLWVGHVEQADDLELDLGGRAWEERAQERVACVDDRRQHVADLDEQLGGRVARQGDLEPRRCRLVQDRRDGDRFATGHEVQSIGDTILLAERDERRVVRRLGQGEAWRLEHEVLRRDDVLDGGREPNHAVVPALHDELRRVLVAGADPVDAGERQVALDRGATADLVAQTLVGDAFEEARAERDDQAGDRDEDEQRQRDASFDPEPSQEHGHGTHQAHAQSSPIRSADVMPVRPSDQVSPTIAAARATMPATSRIAIVDHGTATSTGGNAVSARRVTVTNGSATQAMSRPSALPATRLMIASVAFSRDNQPDNWPDDRPSARSRANSVTRSRAETAALTMNPTIANAAAAATPIASAPMTPSATGSVASA